ncbi:MAG: ferrochelatase [Propionibacteriaceae bacterium]|nr:ferrochelatase [Propionibacteriaceae bacterium]
MTDHVDPVLVDPAAPPAVVLVNLGTPDEPTLPAVQRYLRQFLTDRRIVDLNPLLWRMILETAIMHGHAKRSVAKYASVWLPDGSPLLVHTRDQAAALAAEFASDQGTRLQSREGSGPGNTASIATTTRPTPSDDPASSTNAASRATTTRPQPRDDSASSVASASPTGLPALSDVHVTYAMCYGQPSLPSVLSQLQTEGVWRILVVPLYPQFSTTTVAPIIDTLSAYLSKSTNQPEIRTIRSWPTDPAYIDACAQLIEQDWATNGRPDFARGDKLLLSYHGIPVSCVTAGDPYVAECQATTDALRARLQLGPEHCLMTYQSKFGRGEWVTPATLDTVIKLGQLETPRLDVFCPGFVSDCLETLEELDQLNHDQFISAGGGQFRRVPCLNASPPWMTALAGLIRPHLSGWVA